MSSSSPSPHAVIASLTPDYSPTLRFHLNGSPIILDGNTVDPEATLLDFLRSQRGLTGTKLGCGEGGCGACTVVLQSRHPVSKKIQHLAINACLAPLISVDGKHVITIEALGTSENPHPLQERMWRLHGSQCGFCTPGIIMTLYALLRNGSYEHGYSLTAEQIELGGALDGNLCRCTGYKPILDAAKSFVGEVGKEGEGEVVVPVNFEAAGLRQGEGKGCNGTGGGCGGCGTKTNGVCNGDGGACCAPKQPTPSPCGRADCCRLSSLSSPPSTRTFPPFPLKPYTPSTELIYPPSLALHTPIPLRFGTPTRLWLRPLSLRSLLHILHSYPSARLVSGSSELQISHSHKSAHSTTAPPDTQVHIFLSPHISELYTVSLPASGKPALEFGANLPLAELEQLCADLAPAYPALDAVRHQLRYFAGRQIRNVASVAGNIVTASPISDLNPLWVALGARAVAVRLKEGGQETEEMEFTLEEFFVGYRRTRLPEGAVLTRIVVPLEEGWVVRAYKQAKRKEDDIAIVTAGFAIRVGEDGTVGDVKLAFGGMAPITVSAPTTQSFLVGKSFPAPATLEGALDALGKELDLRFDVPGGMASYRKTLVLSFFYKFWHDVCSSLSPSLTSGSFLATPADLTDILSPPPRALSSGTRDNSDPYAREIVGRQEPHLSGLKHATGEAVYVDDMPRIGTNEAYGALVLSSRAHAKLLRVDPAPALALPGVVAWVDYTDLPDEKANLWGKVKDERFFAVGEVTAHGQPIGLVVAENKIVAQKAARLVVVEYEDLPAVLSIEEALEKGSFHAGYDRRVKRGRDVEEVLGEAECVVEGTTRLGGQEHWYLETMACLIVPKLEAGEMEVFSSTQALTDTQEYVAQVTGVPHNRIVARTKRMGGGFGGKETRASQLAAILAVGAKKTRRAVRCMLDRDEDMMTTGQRHPYLARWKAGATREGKLVALQIELFSNAGYSLDLSGGVNDRAIVHVDNVYYCPNVDARARCCKTNTVSNTAFRGFGGPQGMFVAESYMLALADKLGLDIDHVREINLYKEGEKTHFLQTIEDWHVPRLMKDLRAESEYDRRRAEVDRFNHEHKWRKRGIALIPTKFGLSLGVKAMNQGSALVHIYTDGSVLLAHGGTEMGQGLFTKCCQIAAQELQVPLDTIFTSEASTATVANTIPTAGSAGSDLNGYAVANACKELRERLEPYRNKLGRDAPLADLAAAAWQDRVHLSATGHYATPTLGYEWGNFVDPGKLFYYFTQGVAVTEVEVDILTGDHIVRRVDIKMDVGRSINPAIDYGQIEGAFVQGMGWVTMEESLWTQHNGHLFTRGPGTYKLPGFNDVPQIFNVSLLRDAEWPNLGTIASSKGIGEPPLFLGSSVAFAIRDALKSARADAGVHELQEFRTPLTPERIRLACADFLVKRGRVKAKEGEKNFFVSI